MDVAVDDDVESQLVQRLLAQAVGPPQVGRRNLDRPFDTILALR